MTQCHTGIVGSKLRIFEPCNPTHSFHRRVARPEQLISQPFQLAAEWYPREATDFDRHRMHGSTTEQRHDRIARFLQSQSSGDQRCMVLGHGDPALVAEKVRRLQHEDVQCMAFDPFAAVDHPPQVTQCSVDMQTENLLDRMDRTHLIGHGADAADPSDNVRHFVVMPPLQEGLENLGGSKIFSSTS